jgi:hypothetical protein
MQRSAVDRCTIVYSTGLTAVFGPWIKSSVSDELRDNDTLDRVVRQCHVCDSSRMRFLGEGVQAMLFRVASADVKTI